jgi:Tfp pilus assembly protein PilZ
MNLSDRKIKKYNIYMPQLMNLILSLNPEEHRFLLKNIEKLILDEKRTSPRKACSIPVKYIYNNRTYNSSIVNISRYGCFIETQKPLLVGKKILMDIQWDDDDNPIRINGEVANANRIGIGIEFEDLSDDLLEKLGSLLYKVI